jgi:alanine dehydrogenase
LVRVAPFTEVRIAGRDPRKAESLAKQLAAELETGVSASGSFAEAMSGAYVVCACTHSPEPVVRRSDVEPGMHITSVGYNVNGREVDAETVRDAVVVVESRQAALADPPSGANELTWAIRDGVIGPDHVHAELGELVAGTRPGRASAEQITLYKSVGIGAQDAAAAALVLAAAREQGAGLQVEL